MLIAVLVGIVLYVVLKKMKRNELTWILIPITAVIFTILIYLLGSKMKFKDVVVNSVNIISTDENGKGQINGYIGIGSKNKGNLKIGENNMGNSTGSTMYMFGAVIIIYIVGMLIYQGFQWLRKKREQKRDEEFRRGDE